MYCFHCLFAVLTALAHFTVGTDAQSPSVCQTASPVTIATAGTVTYTSTLTYCTDTPITALPTVTAGASAATIGESQPNPPASIDGSTSPGQPGSGISGSNSGGSAGPVQATSAGTMSEATETPYSGSSGSETGAGSRSNSSGSSPSTGSSSITSGPAHVLTAGAHSPSISNSVSGALLFFLVMVYILALL